MSNEYNENGNETTSAGDATAPQPGEAGDYNADGEAVDESLVVGEEKQPINRGTLVVFGILIIGAAGLFVMYRQAGPKAAIASVNKETVAAKKTITTFLNGGDMSIKSMERLLSDTQKIVSQFLTYPSTTQVPLAELRTNPFRQHIAEAKKDDPAAAEAAEKKKREEERLAIKKAAEGLQLQSIMFSDSRKACMINNSLYREGQAFDDFTVEKITATSVILRNGPYRFQLTTARAGGN